MQKDTLWLLHDYERKISGRQYDLGVLVPWANVAVERELTSLALTNLCWHYARLVPASNTTALDDDFMSGMIDSVPGALFQLSQLRLHRTYLACTSASFKFADRLERIEASDRSRLTTAFDAILETLARFEATRICLLTPYPVEVGRTEEEQFARHGVHVVASHHLGLADGYRDVKTDAILAALEIAGARRLVDANMVVLSCTGWHTLEVIPIIQRQLGVPVVSSNLAIAISAALHCEP